MRRPLTPGLILLIGLAVSAARCVGTEAAGSAEPATYAAPALSIAPALADTATFAGGCFWCMEGPFERIEGVASAVSGFMGGRTANPTYDEVSRGGTGHAEVVQIIYDSTRVDYAQLLDVYWHNVDPLDGDGQFCDRGDTYRPAVFYHDAEQQRLSEETRTALAERFDQPVAAQVVAASAFTPAEAYHQDFYRTHPEHYQSYRIGCRRDARLRELWGAEAGH